MSKKRIIFLVLCALLALVLIMTVVTAVKLIQMFNAPDPTDPTETEPSISESTGITEPSTDPSTQPSTEATVPPTTQPTVPPTTQPTVPPTTMPTEPSATEHIHDFATVLSSQAATCTDSGYKELQCSCGETYWEVIDKLEHPYGYGEAIPVTCTEKGCTRYTCSACGYVEERNVVEATGHAYDGGTVHAATCTEDAYTVYVCANENCPEKEKKEVQANTKLGHNFGPWVEKDGVSTQTCGVCGASHSTEELEITNSMFLDSENNSFRVHEIHVGTELVENIYRYKIEDCINNGSLRFSYEYETGLKVEYKDDFGKNYTIFLDSLGEDYIIENVTEPEVSEPTESPTEAPSEEPTTESTESAEPNA